METNSPFVLQTDSWRCIACGNLVCNNQISFCELIILVYVSLSE